ncbi:hypothetical protein [Chromobacterium violaceum]|uniref:hypothetical protein n=1 Tax=Chromobacterium violaceum TaxID=536 RepID=UPI00143D59FB|nr:hypothetical protein [Chromobacterium violaceum]MBP4044749.1 hypothetical protein [Chromobacterium violaceum]QIY78972.1 hypothetical protein FOB43_07080 [Chromobacterium violaceum]
MKSINRGRMALLAMGLLCLVPVIAAWLAYWLLPPQGGRSYGQLLPTHPFEAASQQAWPRGKWVLAAVLGAECQSRCQQRWHAMRQIEKAQGEAAPRLTRVALQVSDPAARVEVPHRLPHAPQSPLPAGNQGFYLVDPLGNQVMFYRDGADPRRIIDEVAKVLKVNNGLG